MRDFSGRRVAVAGMGVSGLALGKAVLALGGRPTVLDQKPNDSPALIAAVDDLDAAGVEAVTAWHGRLDPADFDLLVVSPGFPRDHPAIRDMVGGGREVWSEVEFAYHIARAPIIAVTGTNGKSTTTVMMWLLASGAGRTSHLCGNIAGSGYPEQTLTEAALKAREGELLVAEVSSYQLEWANTFRPSAAAVTNVTPDHMDRYRRFEDYFETKLRLFNAMTTGDSVIVNLDEPSVTLADVERNLAGPATLVTFSPSGSQQGSGVARREGGRLWLSDMEANLDDLPLFGEHNVTNAMMAWEIVARVVRPNAGMLEALYSFKGLANRMERLGVRDGVTIINNSMCTNPAAVIASSRSTKGRQHLLIGGVTKNLEFAPVGEYLRQTGHRVYLFGPDPEKMNAMLQGDWPHFETMQSAFEAACGAAVSGDTVMLAPGCASADPYSNFRERGDAFREMAGTWLQGAATPR